MIREKLGLSWHDVIVVMIAAVMFVGLILFSMWSQAQVANPQCTQEKESQTTVGLTGTLTFQDSCGTQSNTFEMKVSGGPATNSVTVNGCMRGGTCTALNTSTSTSNVQIPVSGGPFDNYQITWTLTGGASPSLQFNRTGTYAKSSPGSFSGVANAVTVAGKSTLYRGSDMCAAIKAATAAEPTGILSAQGFTGTQVCQTASMPGMFNSNFSGHIYFGCPLNLWVPLALTSAASGNFPGAGVMVLPAQTHLHGCGTSGAAGGNTTTIRACPSSGAPAGCPAPATHEFAITATSVTTSVGHTYLGFTIAGGDLQGAEPIRVQNYQNVANNSFALTVCQPTQQTSARLDPNCPAYPTATTVYAAVNSGIWSSAVSAGGAGYAGTLTATFTGGGCLIEPTATVTQSAGVINSVTVQNRGRGCTSAPTATVAGSGGGAGGTLSSTIATNCASNCGILHAEIPIFDTAPFGSSTFAISIEDMVISCTNTPDCVGVRSLTINEQSMFKHLFITGSPERCMDLHLFTVQNGDPYDGIRCSAGASATSDAGTEAVYFGDNAGHGLTNFTGDFNNSPVPLTDCIRMNADTSQLYFKGGHCENTLFVILLGASNPTRGIHVDDWASGPNAFTLTTGMYQNENPVAIKVRSEYFTNSGGVSGVITSDYQFTNIHRNSCGSTCGTVADDNPLGPNGTGYWITDLYTETYSVDQANNGCETVLTTAQQQPFSNCPPWQLTSVAPKVTTVGGLSPCTANIEGAHEVANNCNAACVAGNACAAGGAVHCEMYCNATPAWAETGR